MKSSPPKAGDAFKKTRTMLCCARPGVVLDIREGQPWPSLRPTFFLGRGEEGFKTQSNFYQDKLWRHARISINQGKTQVWNRSGETPPDCEHLFFDANGEPSGAWRGDHNLPTHEQGITILGTPLGHVDFVQGQLDEKIDEHGVLLDSLQPRSPVCLALALVVRRFPSKLRAPGCQSCVVFPIRTDA